MSKEPPSKRQRTSGAGVELLLTFTAGDNRNPLLKTVNDFLDPLSLYNWGRVVQLAASAHEVGLALFERAGIHTKHGMSPVGDLSVMFQDSLGANLAGETQPTQGTAWRRRHFFCEKLCLSNRNLGAGSWEWVFQRLLEVEQWPQFNQDQLSLVSTVVICLMADGAELAAFGHRDTVVMQDILHAADNLLNIRVPDENLETRYKLRSLRDHLFTLRDIACLDRSLLSHRIGISRWQRSRVPYEDSIRTFHDTVNKMIRQELREGVKKVLLGHKIWVSEEDRPEWYSGEYPDEDEELDAWRQAVKFKVHAVIDRFVEEISSPGIDTEQLLPSTHTSRDVFVEFATRNLFYAPEWTASALDLAQMIMEDFAMGIAVKPFYAQRPGRIPVLCHLIIGRLHGMTMVSFTPLQFSEEAIMDEEATGEGTQAVGKASHRDEREELSDYDKEEQEEDDSSFSEEESIDDSESDWITKSAVHREIYPNV